MRRPRARATAVATAVITAALVGGCASRSSTADEIAPPATASTVRQIRDTFQQQDPSTLVGLVIAVLPDSDLASIGDVPVDQFENNQLVTFIDSRQAIIAVGNVVNMTDDAVHVRYQPHGDKPRAPRIGDLAVKVGS